MFIKPAKFQYYWIMYHGKRMIHYDCFKILFVLIMKPHVSRSYMLWDKKLRHQRESTKILMQATSLLRRQRETSTVFEEVILSINFADLLSPAHQYSRMICNMVSSERGLFWLSIYWYSQCYVPLPRETFTLNWFLRQTRYDKCCISCSE